MPRMALVDGAGKVVNVIVAPTRFKPESGLVAIPAGEAAPGDTWDGAKFVAPPYAPERARTLAEKLEVIGVTLEELKAALQAGTKTGTEK